MRHRSEVLLAVMVGVFGFSGVVAITFLQAPPEVSVVPIQVQPVVVSSSPPGQAWFQSIRSSCNPVDVSSRMRYEPPPATDEGAMYGAACFALAGRIDSAREMIESLPPDTRWRAAGVVFDAGHPAADAGDELAAGPLMELVVDYWPNHYMALYHAGAASFELGAHDDAREYLERFLVEYGTEDGWRARAQTMLKEMR